MTSRFQNSTPKFKIKDENFNDCVSISTNSSISSIKSYRASIKNDSSDSDTDTFDDDSQSMTSTIANNDRETKYETANSGDITNLSQDLDSTVETIYYEEGAEKIRELEQKIACLEKYIKELETSVHLQRTQNAVLRNKETVNLRKELREQKSMTEKLKAENQELEREHEKITKQKSQLENDKDQSKVEIKQELCSNHPEDPLNFKCLDCSPEMSICEKCRKKDHSDHFVETFDSSNDMITVKKELLDQDILEMENKTLKHGLATLQKTLNDMENKMTELKSKMHQKENELSRAKGDLSEMKAQGFKDVQEIAYLKALLECPSSYSPSDQIVQPTKNDEELDNKGVIFDKYVTNLTSTTLALKSELDEVKQELVREKREKFELERAYENAKEGWIAQNQEVQNLHQVIARKNAQTSNWNPQSTSLIFNLQKANASLEIQVKTLNNELKLAKKGNSQLLQVNSTQLTNIRTTSVCHLSSAKPSQAIFQAIWPISKPMNKHE